jgi:hypothetical protein
MSSYFERWTSIVDVRIETFVITKIQFVLEVFHRDTVVLRRDWCA